MVNSANLEIRATPDNPAEPVDQFAQGRREPQFRNRGLIVRDWFVILCWIRTRRPHVVVVARRSAN